MTSSLEHSPFYHFNNPLFSNSLLILKIFFAFCMKKLNPQEGRKTKENQIKFFLWSVLENITDVQIKDYDIQIYLNYTMNPRDTQDLETFLVEAELINEKVKKLANNQMSTKQFDELEAARALDLKKRTRAKQMRQQQALEKKRQGRDGKGITKDFSNFCRFCHRQYQLPTPVCLRCKKDTMTLEQRQQMLGVMVEEYKEKKKKRDQRKMKWEMWQKTKAMLWKKTSNNYDKWEYFVSDSEEEPQQEPIVPKNDPNFKALEADMQERKNKRKKDTEKAQKLKEKGNKEMKEGDYQKAMQFYTLALQHIKDVKSIYTNRALAFLKLGKFKKAIEDCTNVIDYMEVFEKVGDNVDLTFKAYSRRAMAQKEKKNYKEALQDINKALQFYPNDKNAQILKKQVEGFIQHTEKMKKIMQETQKNKQENSEHDKKQEEEIKEEMNEVCPTEEEALQEEKEIIKQLAEQQLKEESKTEPINEEPPPPPKQPQKKKKQYTNPIDDIKDRIQELSLQNIELMIKAFGKNEDLITIFIAAKGIKKCLTQLVESQECKREGYLVSKCLRQDGVGEKEVWDFGVEKLHNRCSQFLNDTTKLNLSKYFILEDIFEVLIPLSLHDKYRQLLNNDGKVYEFIEHTFYQLITKHKKQTELFSQFLIYMGNLCCGQSKLRDHFIDSKKFKTIVQSLFERVLSTTTAKKSYQDLKKNCFSLFANLIRSQAHRAHFNKFMSEKDENGKEGWDKLVQETKLYLRRNDNFTQYIEGLLSVFVNSTFGNPIPIEGLAETLNDRFFINPASFSPQIIHRSLLTASRLKYTNINSFKKYHKSFTDIEVWKKIKTQKNPMQHIVRILNIMYMPTENKQRFEQPLPEALFKELKSYIRIDQKNQMLFCNTANLFSVMLDSPGDIRHILYRELKPFIKQLIGIAKDRIGNWRKNSAILLAKLAQNEDCKEELRKHHGMDVLKSIASFVK